MVADNLVDVTTMRRIFPVINEGFLDFNFSLILENPGNHVAARQPFFRARVLDVNGNVVDNICIVSNPANCLFNSVTQLTGNRLLYTGWVCARLNVQSILGQQGTVEFTVSDCGFAGHQGYVYIDNVCGSICTNPAFGSINLDPLNQNCPTVPFQVCGTYQTPANSTLGALTLNIMQGTTLITTINAPNQLTANTYCFEINPNLFGLNPTGNFTFQVNVIFNVNCPTGVFQYNATNINGIISFNNCCLPTLTLTSADNMTNSNTDAITLRERSDWIRATNTIGIGNSTFQDGVVYHAENFVELNPGFEAVLSSQFSAYPLGCTGTYVYKNSTPTINSPVVIDSKLELIKISRGFSIIPNPSSNAVEIVMENAKFNKITIVSIDGKKIFENSLQSADKFQVDISSYTCGIYIVNVTSDSGQVYTSKLIKN